MSQRECEKAEIVVKVCGGDDSVLCRIIGKLFNGKSLHSYIDEIMPMFTHLPTSHCVVLMLTTEQKSIGNIYSFNHDGMSNGIFQAAFLLLPYSSDSSPLFFGDCDGERRKSSDKVPGPTRSWMLNGKSIRWIMLSRTLRLCSGDEVRVHTGILKWRWLRWRDSW